MLCAAVTAEGRLAQGYVKTSQLCSPAQLHENAACGVAQGEQKTQKESWISTSCRRGAAQKPCPPPSTRSRLWKESIKGLVLRACTGEVPVRHKKLHTVLLLKLGYKYCVQFQASHISEGVSQLEKVQGEATRAIRDFKTLIHDES